MLLKIKGKGDIKLTKTHFVNQGGEGQVYAKDNVAYKIYTDPKKMIPAGKIQELSTITHDDVIRPRDIILDNHNIPVGYTMKYVKDNYVLCQLFTRTFRDREGVTHEIIQDLIKNIRTIIQHIHDKNILVVDVNEMNFLVNKSFNTIYAIDVDSYKTKSFPATALMDSVKDRHSKEFTQETDWFSFGIITFQLFAGIHPFKGKHASVKTLDDRMLQNISVFNSSVSVPKICYPLDIIPEAYRRWYKAIFEDGKRLAPPLDFQIVTQIISRASEIIGADGFEINELCEVNEDIIDVLFGAGKRIIQTNKSIVSNNKTFFVSSGVKVALSPQSDTAILCKVVRGNLELFNLEDKSKIDCNLFGSEMMEYENRVYIKNSDHILKLELTELGNKILPSTKIVANILENAAKLFDGVVVQNLLDACYISIFPDAKTHKQIRIKELEPYRIIDAKYDSLVLMVIGIKNGVYDKFIIRFDGDFVKYDIRKIENIFPSGFNFVVLDNGMCISLNESEELELFPNKIGSDKLRVIKNSPIHSGTKLFKNGSQLLFSNGNKLFSIKMK